MISSRKAVAARNAVSLGRGYGSRADEHIFGFRTFDGLRGFFAKRLRFEIKDSEEDGGCCFVARIPLRLALLSQTGLDELSDILFSITMIYWRRFP